MENVTSIFKNREKPPTLIENILHIARAQQPKVSQWGHMCREKQMDYVMVDEGCLCKFCSIDQNGVSHARKD